MTLYYQAQHPKHAPIDYGVMFVTHTFHGMAYTLWVYYPETHPDFDEWEFYKLNPTTGYLTPIRETYYCTHTPTDTHFRIVATNNSHAHKFVQTAHPAWDRKDYIIERIEND